VLVVALVAVVATGVSAWRRADAAHPAVVAPEFRSVDPTVPEAKLLDSVRYVDAWREFGNPVGFTSVPAVRPPGLTGVFPGNPPNLGGGSHRGTGNGASLDNYHVTVDGHRLSVVVEFSAEPTSTCADTEGMTAAVCVRNEATGAGHVTVYLTGVHGPVDIDEAQRFWADVEMVPVGEAAWFAGLAARARAAVLR